MDFRKCASNCNDLVHVLMSFVCLLTAVLHCRWLNVTWGRLAPSRLCPKPLALTSSVWQPKWWWENLWMKPVCPPWRGPSFPLTLLASRWEVKIVENSYEINWVVELEIYIRCIWKIKLKLELFSRGSIRKHITIKLFFSFVIIGLSHNLFYVRTNQSKGWLLKRFLFVMPS